MPSEEKYRHREGSRSKKECICGKNTATGKDAGQTGAGHKGLPDGVPACKIPDNTVSHSKMPARIFPPQNSKEILPYLASGYNLLHTMIQ